MKGLNENITSRDKIPMSSERASERVRVIAGERVRDRRERTRPAYALHHEPKR
jgi:hypothetical protein